MRRRSVPALSDVVAYQSAVSDLTTLSLADLITFWRSLDTADAVGSTVAVREFMPDLMDTYAPMSAELAAQFYDETRDKVKPRSSWLSILAPGPSSDRLQDRIGWAVKGLFAPEPKPQAALSLLSGETQLEIADTARETVQLNAEADPAQPRYSRHASANACAFCALMATRGAVYRSANAAGAAKKYHAHCHCVAIPVFEGDEDESPPYVLDWERAYRSAVKAARKAGIQPDLHGVLPFMRQSLGAA